jgi:hypothetical protein
VVKPTKRHGDNKTITIILSSLLKIIEGKIIENKVGYRVVERIRKEKRLGR